MNSNRRLTHATLSKQLEDAIRTDIIEGLLPPGERLRVLDLTMRYGVSATPLREAFQRLAAENLVELDPRSGATVTDISLPDLHDTYWLLSLLESAALERSIRLGDTTWEADVRKAWDQFLESASRSSEDGAEVVPSEEHAEFHRALYEACDSPWLLRFVANLRHHAERYRMLSARTGVRHSVEEHQEILKFALKRDTERAVESHRRHLERTVETLGPLVSAAPTEPTGQERAAAMPSDRREAMAASRATR